MLLHGLLLRPALASDGCWWSEAQRCQSPHRGRGCLCRDAAQSPPEAQRSALHSHLPHVILVARGCRQVKCLWNGCTG